MHRHATSRRTTTWAFLLAWVLLYAQWMGLQHGVVHAGWQGMVAVSDSTTLYPPGLPDPMPAVDSSASNGNSHTAGIADSHGKRDATHSCAAFDAAAMADALPALLAALLPKAPAHCQSARVAIASWDAPLLLPFSSRAPPAA